MDAPKVFVSYLIAPGLRPPFWHLARALWGSEDFDSDGDSATPDDVRWTELTLRKRPGYAERVDIDPVSEDPLVLKVRGTSSDIVERTVEFLRRSAGGEVASQWDASTYRPSR